MVFLLVLAGHGALESFHDDHAEHGVLVVCILLFTVFALGAVAWRPERSSTVASPRLWFGSTRLRIAMADGRARGSPALLQRFLT